MHLTIRYLDGQLVDAIVLAISADRMRVLTAACDDTLELNLTHGVWLTETGHPVEFDSMMLDADFSAIFSEIGSVARPAVRAAAN